VSAKVGHKDVETIERQVWGEPFARSRVKNATILNGAVQHQNRRARHANGKPLEVENIPAR
jgi:hypothetical protein